MNLKLSQNLKKEIKFEKGIYTIKYHIEEKNNKANFITEKEK